MNKTQQANDKPPQEVSLASPDLPQPGQTKTGRVPRWLWLGCILAVVAASLHSADKHIGGGDTWVAMMCGRYQLHPWCVGQPGRTWQMRLLDKFGVHITQKDPFSAKTRPYDPAGGDDVGWVNQNWLTHILFYQMKSFYGTEGEAALRGENLIVFYKFLQAVLTGLFAYWAARVLGAHPLLAAGAAAFGMLLSRSYIDLRPNVSTIFFAAFMIVLLSYWRKGRFWALAAMVPAMIVWANFHGGFIYAIMIFAIVLAGYAAQQYLGKHAYWVVLAGLGVTIFLLLQGSAGLSDMVAELNRKQLMLRSSGNAGDAANCAKQATTVQLWRIGGILAALATFGIAVCSMLRFSRLDQNSFVHMGKRGLLFLLAGLVMVIIIPAVFSPFGMENLIHPLTIAAGDEGNQWRQVVEWKPIFDVGFGNTLSYAVFLACFGMALVAWWFLFFSKPQTDNRRARRQRQTDPTFPWPRIDLAQIGIIAITLIMSIKSRRFVFLGGVVLAPFLAATVQDVINMIGVRRLAKRQQPTALPVLPRRLAWGGVALSLLGTIAAAIVFGYSMHNQYFKNPGNENVGTNVFRRMVVVADQPVAAMEFFKENHLEGVVLNGWTHGGFVGFHQTPNPDTGEPPCKLFIDGRAQAAYAIDHYQHWGNLKQFWNRRGITVEALEKRLDSEGVNLALFDAERRDELPAIRLLEKSKNWMLVFPYQGGQHLRYRFFAERNDPRNKDFLLRWSKMRREQRLKKPTPQTATQNSNTQ